MLINPKISDPIRIICGITRCSMPGEFSTGNNTLITYQRDVEKEIVTGLITEIICALSFVVLLRRKLANI